MQMTLELLRQSGDVPIIFAIVTRTGHVMMEELTDAETSLDWELEALRAPREPTQSGLLHDSSPAVDECPTSPAGAEQDLPSFDAIAEDMQNSDTDEM